MIESKAPLLPPNQRPQVHPALVTDPTNQSNYFKVQADPLEQFSVFNGLALALLIGLAICTLVMLSHKTIAKFYKFFLLSKPHRNLKLKPFQTNSNDSQKPSLKQTIVFAFKTQKPSYVYLFETALFLMLVISAASCLSMAIQWNSCLNRVNANYSFSCLNMKNGKVRDSYFGGVIVGGLVFILTSTYNSYSWQALKEYADIFKTEPSKVQILQKELFQKIESDLDKQSVTTMGPASSERNALIGLMAEKEIVPAIKKFKELNELVQIDEDENDEHCSPVKPRGKNASPVKRFKPNDSIRSEEHISPTKGAIQFKQLDGNESADDGDLVIRAHKMDISKSIQSIQFSQPEEKESKPIQAVKVTHHQSKTRAILKTISACLAFITLLFTLMVSLYFYANTTQLGLTMMYQSVGIALGTHFILSVPVFVRNFKKSKTFLAQDQQKLEVILKFWQSFEQDSQLIGETYDDNEANLDVKQLQAFKIRIGNSYLEYELFTTNLSDQVEIQAVKQHAQPAFEPTSKQSSKSLFSPKSPTYSNREVVPVSGSVSFIGEAPPSNRSQQNQILKFSQTNFDEHSDPSIEEIGQSPNKRESPKRQKPLMSSVKKPVFSSGKKTHQFETPKLSGAQMSSKKDLIPESALPTFNLPDGDLAQKQSEEGILSMVLSPARIEPKKIGDSKIPISSKQSMPQKSDSSENRSPLQSLKKFSQRAGEGVKNLFRNIGKSGLSLINKKSAKVEKLDLSESKVDNHKDQQKDEQYSPLWSSVKRETKSQLMKYRPGTEESKLEVEDILSNNLPSLKQLQTINQKSEEDSPQASKRLAYADIQNADKAEKSAGRSYNKKKFNSPNSLQRSFREATGERGEQLSQRGSQSKYGGEHTTARKRRLMMMDDAAGSSINFKNNSAGLGSIAHHTQNSLMRETRMVQYQSLGSVCSGLRNNESNDLLSGNKDLVKDESQVMIGSGEVDDQNITIENLLSDPYQGKITAEIELKKTTFNLDSDHSVPIKSLQPNKSKKVVVLRADSEVDSASVHQNSALNNYQASERSNVSPSGQQISAFEKLVKSSKKLIDSGRNNKRSLSVNETTSATQFQKNLAAVATNMNAFKDQVILKSEIRRVSEPPNKQQEKTLSTVSALKAMSQNLTKQSQKAVLAINKISIEEFKTQQEQRLDTKEALTREAVRQTKLKDQDNYNSIGGQNSKITVGSRYSSRQGMLTQKENKLPETRQTGRDRNQLKSQQPPNSKQTNQRSQITSALSAERTSDRPPIQNLTNPSESGLEFVDYEKYTDEEIEQIKKAQQMNEAQHRQDQRRRLEHFLSVARQAHAKQDVQKIKILLKELHDAARSLPASRINDLRHLDIMTSPYNQTLISMLKVENAQQRRFKELQTQQQIYKGKYFLPKNQGPGCGSQTGFKPSQERLKDLRRIAGFDSATDQRLRNQLQYNSSERSASSIERAMLANAGSQILEGENSARSYGQRQGSNASDVYQINTRFEPLQRNEYQFGQPKSVLNYSKPDFITFENPKLEDISTNKQNSPASNYQNY